MRKGIFKGFACLLSLLSLSSVCLVACEGNPSGNDGNGRRRGIQRKSERRVLYPKRYFGWTNGKTVYCERYKSSFIFIHRQIV